MYLFISFFLFFCFWLCWFFTDARAFFLVVRVGSIFIVVLRLHCSGFSCEEHGPRAHRPSVVVARGPVWGSCSSCALDTGSVVVDTGLHCSMHGLWDLPSQGFNPCLLHWKTDLLLLRHQGNRSSGFKNKRHTVLWHWVKGCGLSILTALGKKHR